MINFKRALAAVVCCALCTVTVTACGDDKDSKNSASTVYDTSAGGYINYTAPQEGEEILVITIKDHGDIKIKLFPEEAEKGVENIKGLAKDGYYDGLIFHRIINNFMIQGGDPLGNGTGGESMWGGSFEGGTSDKLTHVAGAIAYANSGATSTNGSQFYIVTGEKMDDNTLELYAANGITVPEAAQDLYKTEGGAFYLDGGYTVFGQVFEGLDIVFDLQAVSTDANDKPVEDVVIEKMSVEKYDGGDVKFRMSDYK